MTRLGVSSSPPERTLQPGGGCSIWGASPRQGYRILGSILTQGCSISGSIPNPRDAEFWGAFQGLLETILLPGMPHLGEHRYPGMQSLGQHSWARAPLGPRRSRFGPVSRRSRIPALRSSLAQRLIVGAAFKRGQGTAALPGAGKGRWKRRKVAVGRGSEAGARREGVGGGKQTAESADSKR